MKRYAIVSTKKNSADVVARYLPANYKVIATVSQLDKDTDPFGDFTPCAVVQGEDRAGWTMDAYVLPRLGSGLILAREVDLSHPVMKQIDIKEIEKLNACAEICQKALDVQDAGNLRAIARLLVEAADRAADAGGTRASYCDPAVVLIVNKIESLVYSSDRFAEAYDQCKRMTNKPV